MPNYESPFRWFLAFSASSVSIGVFSLMELVRFAVCVRGLNLWCFLST
jgi:hypothetical protein